MCCRGRRGRYGGVAGGQYRSSRIAARRGHGVTEAIVAQLGDIERAVELRWRCAGNSDRLTICEAMPDQCGSCGRRFNRCSYGGLTTGARSGAASWAAKLERISANGRNDTRAVQVRVALHTRNYRGCAYYVARRQRSRRGRRLIGISR